MNKDVQEPVHPVVLLLSPFHRDTEAPGGRGHSREKFNFQLNRRKTPQLSQPVGLTRTALGKLRPEDQDQPAKLCNQPASLEEIVLYVGNKIATVSVFRALRS